MKNKQSFGGWFLRHWGKILLSVLVIFLAGFAWIVEYALPFAPIRPIHRTGVLTPTDLGIAYQNLDIEVEKGLILRGYLLKTLDPKPKGTIISVHGIGGYKEMALNLGQFLTQNGFNMLVFDQRAHGKSGGQYCTFGYYEKLDISKYIDTLQKLMPDQHIGIYGASLGGAVALQALEMDKRLKFGIVESTFNTLENVVVEYGRDYFKFRSHWLARRVLTKSAVIARFEPFEIQPVRSCRNIEQPMFMAHGDEDQKIPIEFNQDNFNNLKSTDKEFYIVKGAGHLNLGTVGGATYRAKILNFLNHH